MREIQDQILAFREPELHPSPALSAGHPRVRSPGAETQVLGERGDLPIPGVPLGWE